MDVLLFLLHQKMLCYCNSHNIVTDNWSEWHRLSDSLGMYIHSIMEVNFSTWRDSKGTQMMNAIIYHILKVRVWQERRVMSDRSWCWWWGGESYWCCWWEMFYSWGGDRVEGGLWHELHSWEGILITDMLKQAGEEACGRRRKEACSRLKLHFSFIMNFKSRKDVQAYKFE